MALKLGYFNVDAMLASGNASQLESWYEYYQIEPFGDEQRIVSTAFARLCNVIKEVAYWFIPNAQLPSNQLFKDDVLVMKLRKKPPTKKERLAAAVKGLENMEPI